MGGVGCGVNPEPPGFLSRPPGASPRLPGPDRTLPAAVPARGALREEGGLGPPPLAGRRAGVAEVPTVQTPTSAAASSVRSAKDSSPLGCELREGDCSHEIKRRLLLGRKVMTNLDSILKSRDITLPTKVHLVQAMIFPVVMYGCESWTIKKAEHQRIDAFELWCWRRLLRVPWTARRSNQSNLREISPEYSLEGLMLKMKLQYFGHLMQRTNPFEKTLMLGKIEGGRRRRRQRMRWLNGITHSMDMEFE